ncbi:VCBS domain-containing protein, partial [Pseudooceanicola aestuarii]|uniref:VCBS domain-containing protein n=1 Tax=Pseudooceanicola aestuarii TaxID=2697319 RepID=UPI0013D1C70B
WQSASGQATHGSYQIGTDGNWSYVLGNSATVNALGQGETLSDSFTATTADGTTQAVTITITGTNDAPEVLAPSTLTGALGEDDGPVSGQGQASDPEGDTLTWSGTALGVLGSFAVTDAGAWTYTPGAEADSLAQGATATETYTLTVTDSGGATATETVTITLTGANDAPVALDDIVVAPLGETTDTAFRVRDPDLGEDLSFALLDAPGFVQIVDGDSFRLTPDGSTSSGLYEFDYRVTDGQGATDVATVQVYFDNAQAQGGGGGAVSIGFNTEPANGNPAGFVDIDVSEVDGAKIRLAIAMDGSGSIGQSSYDLQIDAVVGALEALARQFEGSATEVEVLLVPYSSSVISYPVYDLQDFNPDTTGGLGASDYQGFKDDYQGGGTYWADPLNTAKAFFTDDDGGETTLADTNILYFITDGQPSDTTSVWQGARDDLKTLEINGQGVLIEAFGIGSGYNSTNLDTFETPPGSTQVTAASDLTDAFAASPLFAAALVEFSLSLMADGVNHADIVTETSPILSNDGLSYTLDLAQIQGIADLLGEANLFTTQATFDFDGDASDNANRVTLTAGESVSKRDVAVDTDLSAGHDLYLGSDLADDIRGLSGDDVLLGYDGDDLLSGGAGNDTILSGAGNDTVIGGAGTDRIETGSGDDLIRLDALGDLDGPGIEVLDAGAGYDVLHAMYGGDVASGLLERVAATNVEVLDLTNAVTDSGTMTMSDIFNLSGTNGADAADILAQNGAAQNLRILGDVGDSLTLMGDGGSFVAAQSGPATVTDDQGNLLAIYHYIGGSGTVLAAVGVDQDIAVSAVVTS